MILFGTFTTRCTILGRLATLLMDQQPWRLISAKAFFVGKVGNAPTPPGFQSGAMTTFATFPYVYRLSTFSCINTHIWIQCMLFYTLAHPQRIELCPTGLEPDWPPWPGMSAPHDGNDPPSFD